MTKYQFRFLLAIATGSLMFGCAQEESASLQGEETPTVIDHTLRAETAIASPSRFAEDRSDDHMRQPDSVLAFVSIEPGMTVFEIEAGGGYYTELFSALVGSDGAVIMQSPEIFDSFLADPIAARLAANRLPNVRLSKTNFDNLDAADNSVDIVTWFLGPHELYFTPNGSSGLGDVETAYAEIIRVLKPGGVFIVLDHAAASGSPETTGGALHRIDPVIVMGLATSVGFAFVEESDVLRNPNDHYSMSVFDPVVRRKTDRFLLKYIKPE